MKREERDRRIREIRTAADEAHAADLALEALTHRRALVDTVVSKLLGGSLPINSVEDVPSAMRRAWAEAERQFPHADNARQQTDAERAGRRLADALAKVYTAELERAVQQLSRGEPGGVKFALLFLEADPYCFRSGYTKQRLMRYLRHVPLTGEHKRQLRSALLTALKAGGRPEFREACRIARVVEDARFLRQLRLLRRPVVRRGRS